MDNTENVNSYFDSPERVPIDKVLADSELLRNDGNIVQLLEGFPDLALILNEHRQIVLCNSTALKIFDVNDIVALDGKRFGEAFNCIHKNEMDTGCGTSRFCRECGAAKALLRTKQFKETADEECRIVVMKNGKEVSFDFFVKTKPYNYKDNEFTLLAVRDISGDKRRDSLERIFFHDVLNTATAVNGLTELLSMANDPEENIEIQNALRESAEQLLNEIVSQREIRLAEDGNLSVNFAQVSALSIITKIYDIYKKHKLSLSKNFLIDFPDNDIIFDCDQTLLIRSIGNLVKNALEATQKNGTISLDFEFDDDSVQFNVRNDAVIPPGVSVQLFKRSFSTKESKGRGLGLYSVKLIVEHYLNGKALFVSDEKQKTVFSIKLPIRFN